MSFAKSILVGRALLAAAIRPVAGARVPVPRFRVRARALLLMATVLPVAPALSTASATASVPSASVPLPSVPSVVPDLCADKTPPMPSSTGAEVPAVRVQMQGAKLSPGSASTTLALAYEEFNDMKCSRYQQNYEEAPPSYFYFDCVGFTGYTLEWADPRAWASLRRMVGFQAGQVTPTPLEFVDFFRGLGARPQAGWRADPTVASIQAGDILAWQPLVPGVGHAVIPLVAPEPIAGSGRLRWEVVVEDSTQDPHGPLDTRSPANPLSRRNASAPTGQGKPDEPSGLGIGTMVLDTDAAGVVTGVQWSVEAKVAAQPVQFGAGHPL
jgi:hypothetical protein